MANVKVGTITHYFDKIQVAVLEIEEEAVRVGDTIYLGEEPDGFAQKISSMQVEHVSVEEAKKGDAVGLKVDQAVHKGIPVYKVI